MAAADNAAKPLDNHRQMPTDAEIGPAHDRRRTVLDNLPTPTDLRVAVRVQFNGVRRRTLRTDRARWSSLNESEP